MRCESLLLYRFFQLIVDSYAREEFSLNQIVPHIIFQSMRRFYVMKILIGFLQSLYIYKHIKTAIWSGKYKHLPPLCGRLAIAQLNWIIIAPIYTRNLQSMVYFCYFVCINCAFCGQTQFNFNKSNDTRSLL